MTRLLVSSLLLLLTACPPPTDQTCQRVLVDPNGSTNQGFGGGPATGNQPAPLGVVGTPITLSFFAPLSACVSDPLRADVTALDPDNLPLTMRVDSAPARVGAEGAVKLTITFTPIKPGSHALRVSFEPSLGARTQLLDVAADGLAGLTTRVPIPTGANCAANALWPLSDDTVACEERSTGFTSITSADGGLSRFPGEQLVVVDTVLWSIDATTTTLERRVFEDGGLRVTHRFPNFPAIATPAMHDVDLAPRFRANGRLAVVQLTSNGSTVLETNLDGSAGPPLAYFIEADRSVFRWSPGDCSSGCVNLSDLIALEPGLVWRGSSSFDEVPVGPKARGFARPTTLDATPRFTLSQQPDPVSTPAWAFERIPLWLGASAGTSRVLVSVENDALVFTAWPPHDVLRVGRHHLVLADPDLGFVRVVRR
jgi:hypothetical protein